MIWLFPQFEHLQLAITSGLIPENVLAARAEFCTDDDGRIWVSCDAAESLDQSALKRLGVVPRKTTRGSTSPSQEVSCWPQILPLEKISSEENGLSERTPVLFDVPESVELSELITEMLRLGNDRQSFRQQQTEEGVRTLLQVKGPPYYTLLRAVDAGSTDEAPQAFIEQHPRVWVRYGYQHPLAERLQPAEGTLLFVNENRDWWSIPEGKFRDIYEMLRFTVSQAPVQWETKELSEPIKVRLRLEPHTSDDPAELWVLSKAGISQLEELVCRADDRLISRLAFAVGESQDSERNVVVVKVRPGKEPPPVLIFEGVACRSYLRLPNLFVPVGFRLTPPLRRDAIKRLLASDPERNTWLVPDERNQFVPQSLPDRAFRPLSEWVNYVLEKEREPLTAWRKNMQFDFEPFVCKEPLPGPEKSKPDQHPNPKPSRLTPKPSPTAEKKSTKPTKKSETEPKDSSSPANADRSKATTKADVVTSPSKLQERLQRLEQELRDSKEPADSPVRQELWRNLAETHYALDRNAEGTLSFLHAIWEQDPPEPDWIETWFRLETNADEIAPLTGDAITEILAAERPTPSQLNLLAIHTITAAFGGSSLFAESRARLGQVHDVLKRGEPFLPIRLAWLAWRSCAILTDRDHLTLARSRDRLLERIYQYGLSPDLELPAFLRSQGPKTGTRYRTIQTSLQEFRPQIREWIQANFDRGKTAAYAELILAYGYSRVGLEPECQALLAETEAALETRAGTNPVHQWVFEAYSYRIEQSLRGESRHGQLSPELMSQLTNEEMDLTSVYVLNSLRVKSKILQPYEHVNSHDRFLKSYSERPADSPNELLIQIDRLTDIDNHIELEEHIQRILKLAPPEQFVEVPDDDPVKQNRRDISVIAKSQQVVLSSLLSFAPRLGEAASAPLLREVLPACDRLTDPGPKVILLERGLFVSAHFGQIGYARDFAERLYELFQSASQAGTAGLFGFCLSQCFRSLRMLGMRGDISRILERFDQLLSEGRFQAKTIAKPQKRKVKSPYRKAENSRGELDLMTLKLALSAGWFSFEETERSVSLLNEAEQFLLGQQGLSWNLRLDLACRYARMLDQAPIEIAVPKLKALFAQLTQEHISRGMALGMQGEYYAFEPLMIVEAVVLALVSDDFILDPESRKVLDENEFAIRRRLRNDVEALKPHAVNG